MERARQRGTKREETQTTRMKRNRKGRDDDRRGRGKDYYELRQSNTGTVLKRGSICGGEGVKVGKWWVCAAEGMGRVERGRVQGGYGYLMQLYLDLFLSIKRKGPPFRQASE